MVGIKVMKYFTLYSKFHEIYTRFCCIFGCCKVDNHDYHKLTDNTLEELIWHSCVTLMCTKARRIEFPVFLWRFRDIALRRCYLRLTYNEVRIYPLAPDAMQQRTSRCMGREFSTHGFAGCHIEAAISQLVGQKYIAHNSYTSTSHT